MILHGAGTWAGRWIRRQQRRIIAAAEAWLASHPDDVYSDIRFDVMLVAPKSIPRHIMAAFDTSQ